MNELPVEVSLHFLENFRLLMQSCCFLFFFSRPFHEKFKFLKNCPYHFHKILHSHSTPKGAPACSKASKSYDWNVRNTAKISPKMAKKQSFFDLFRFSQKVFIFISAVSIFSIEKAGVPINVHHYICTLYYSHHSLF